MNADVEARILSALERGLATARGPSTEFGTAQLAADVYGDPERTELECKLLFRRRWIPIVRTERLREPGSFVTFELVGDQLVCLRETGGTLRVLHNVCPHRGAQILREECGRVDDLRCPYHALTFALDGALSRMPSQGAFPAHFGPGKTRLAEVSLEEYAGWVWVHLDPPDNGLAAALGPVWIDEFENWPLEDLELVHRLELECEFDWKLGVEAFLEPYHVPAIHPQTAAPVVEYRGMTCRYDGEHSRMALPYRSPNVYEEDGILGHAAASAGVRPFARLNRVQMRAHFVYLLFPSTIWMLFPNHVLALLFLPTSPGRCRIHVELLAAAPADDRARTFLESLRPSYDELLREDLENLPWIQRGVRDSSFTGLELGGFEERIHHFRRILDAAVRNE